MTKFLVENISLPQEVETAIESQARRAISCEIEGEDLTLPIVDGEGRLVGMVTRDDLTLRVGRMPPPDSKPFDNRARHLLYSDDSQQEVFAGIVGSSEQNYQVRDIAEVTTAVALGVPALVWGTHMRARRRQGWWVCAFGVGATAPIAQLLVDPQVYNAGTREVQMQGLVVADSAQFSSCVTELGDPQYIGTALTIQMCIGFLLTTISIELIPKVDDWRYAFMILAPGPLFGVISMLRLRRLPEAIKIAHGKR